MALNPVRKARLEAELKKNTTTIKTLSDTIKTLKKRNYGIRNELAEKKVD